MDAEKLEKIGSWAFILGILLSIVLALVPGMLVASTATTLLVVFGLIVGLLNIEDKHISKFLIAVIALAVAGSANLSVVPAIGDYMQPALANIRVFVAPAAVVVALKAVYDIGKA